MRPQLQDVARRAGVSPSAASAALRANAGTVRLSESTRQRIIQAAEELGYRSNPLARGLRGQSTRTIGVLWWLGSPPARESMARRIARMLQQHDYATYVADHFSSPKQVADVLTDFRHRGVDGIVLDCLPEAAADPAVRKALEPFGAVVVVQTTDEDVSLGTDVIVHDRRSGTRQAIDHLVTTGRRNPLFLVARYARAGKAEAFLDQLTRHGLPSDEARVMYVDEDRADNVAQLGFDALEARYPDGRGLALDALLATSDELAIGAIAWLRQHGYRVPNDVAVVGSNDTHVSPYLTPPLASIDRRDPEVVGEIERRLFHRLTCPDAPRTVGRVDMQFIPRASANGNTPGNAPAGNGALDD